MKLTDAEKSLQDGIRLAPIRCSHADMSEYPHPVLLGLPRNGLYKGLA
jgi:hypothetical protein